MWREGGVKNGLRRVANPKVAFVAHCFNMNGVFRFRLYFAAQVMNIPFDGVARFQAISVVIESAIEQLAWGERFGRSFDQTDEEVEFSAGQVEQGVVVGDNTVMAIYYHRAAA